LRSTLPPAGESSPVENTEARLVEAPMRQAARTVTLDTSDVYRIQRRITMITTHLAHLTVVHVASHPHGLTGRGSPNGNSLPEGAKGNTTPIGPMGGTKDGAR